MIWDTFLFFNELDLLDLRLNVHGPFVDRFVLVESTRDFRGRPKPLYYLDNRSMFREFNSRICHVVVDNPAWVGRDPWLNEAEQRNSIKFGLNDAKAEDIVLVSDLDEMVDFKTFTNLDFTHSKIIMREFMYYLNLNHGREIWKSADIYKMRTLQESGADLHQLRHAGDRHSTPDLCGWHFTYMGGPDKVKQKLQSFSHSEFDTPIYTDLPSIAHRIENRINVTGTCQPLSLEKIPITEATHPKFLVENQERYKHLILQ